MEATRGNSITSTRTVERRASQSCDALIVGGGPSGLAAAIALRQRGLHVVVADALVPPIDKACGEGLMPDARAILARLGVDLRAGHEFSGIRFVGGPSAGEMVATADFTHGKGIGVSRVELHQALVDHAQCLGIRLKWGARVEYRNGAAIRVGGEAFTYKYLIGADGEASRVRRCVDLEAGFAWTRRFGFRRHYRVAPWSRYVEVHWGSAGQAYVTPVAGDQICVAVVTRHRRLHFDSVLAGIPVLATLLRGAQVAGRPRGGVTTTRRLNRVTSGNIALVGDASGSADAITGQGLASSFREALLLGDAVGRNDLQAYEAGHRAVLRLPQAMATIMLAMDRSSALSDRVLRTLSTHPDLFRRMLQVHTAEERIAHFAVSQGMRLAFRLLHPGKHRNSADADASHMSPEKICSSPPETGLTEEATELGLGKIVFN